MRRPAPTRHVARRREAGVAAIEFTLVLPILLLLFFGLINLSQYIFAVRKVDDAAFLITNLVAQSENTIPSGSLDDYFVGAELLLAPIDATWVNSNLGIDIYVFNKTTGAVKWSKFYGGSRKCTRPTATDAKIAVLIPVSDVVVTVACMPFNAPAADFPGFQYLRNTTIETRYVQRPRLSDTLSCANPC